MFPFDLPLRSRLRRGMARIRSSVGRLFFLGPNSWGAEQLFLGEEAVLNEHTSVCLYCIVSGPSFHVLAGAGSFCSYSVNPVPSCYPPSKTTLFNFFLNPSSHQCHSLCHWKLIITTHWGEFPHDRNGSILIFVTVWLCIYYCF